MACHRKTLAEGGGGGERQGRSRDTQTPQGMVGRSRDAFRDIQTPWEMVHWGATRDFSYPERNGVMVYSKIFRPRREWCNDAILRPRREDGRYQRFLRPRKEWCSGVFKDTQTRRNWGGLGTGASAAYHRSQGDSGFVIAPRGIAERASSGFFCPGRPEWPGGGIVLLLSPFNYN